MTSLMFPIYPMESLKSLHEIDDNELPLKEIEEADDGLVAA
jgi:hypothetical protein